MDEFLIKAAQLILAFTILVTVHEFGHYLFARIFGMRVDRFYLFFNPWFSLLKYYPRENKIQLIAWTKKDGEKEVPKSLISFNVGKAHPAEDGAKPTWRDTLYGIGWLPLGGYCSIAGMIDETSTDSDKLASEPEPWEFRAKKPVPRLLVMLAGVIFNFILAIIIYIGIAFHWGDRFIPFNQATEGMDFAAALHDVGFRDGDIIMELNGKPADASDDSFQWNLVQDGALVTVDRNGTTERITIPDGFVKSIVNNNAPLMQYRVPVVVKKPVKGEFAAEAGIEEGDRILRVANDTTPSLTEFYKSLAAHKGQSVPMLIDRGGRNKTVSCRISDGGKIGIQLTDPLELFKVKEVHYSLLEAIPQGVGDGVDRLTTYVSSLKLVFSKEGAQSLGGFGAIGDMFPAQWSWFSFWNITAFLSVILAFMNILPIPALDGGHVVFTLWEIITRRKPSEKVLEYAQVAGMAFLFLLLIYTNGNDIYRFFLK